MVNEAFGWLWITAGLVSGLVLGLRFGDEKFLGGYSSWARRLVRLGHISFFGLGLLNILFALGAERIALSQAWVERASWGFVIGGVTMPLCCGLAAWKKGLCPLFVVPVSALVFGASVTTWGMAGGAR